MSSVPAQFAAAKYLNLESFRKNGAGVRTPVWFAPDENGVVYVYSRADSWKVKRIRNNPRIRIAPCDARGKVKGEWVDATARVFAPGDAETVKAHRLLGRKYVLKRLADRLAPHLQKRQAAIVIKIPTPV